MTRVILNATTVHLCAKLICSKNTIQRKDQEAVKAPTEQGETKSSAVVPYTKFTVFFKSLRNELLIMILKARGVKPKRVKEDLVSQIIKDIENIT